MYSYKCHYCHAFFGAIVVLTYVYVLAGKKEKRNRKKKSAMQISKISLLFRNFN